MSPDFLILAPYPWDPSVPTLSDPCPPPSSILPHLPRALGWNSSHTEPILCWTWVPRGLKDNVHTPPCDKLGLNAAAPGSVSNLTQAGLHPHSSPPASQPCGGRCPLTSSFCKAMPHGTGALHCPTNPCSPSNNQLHCPLYHAAFWGAGGIGCSFFSTPTNLFCRSCFFVPGHSSL